MDRCVWDWSDHKGRRLAFAARRQGAAVPCRRQSQWMHLAERAPARAGWSSELILRRSLRLSHAHSVPRPPAPAIRYVGPAAGSFRAATLFQADLPPAEAQLGRQRAVDPTRMG